LSKDNFEIIKILFDVSINVARALSRRINTLLAKDFRDKEILFDVIIISINIAQALLRKVYILKSFYKVNLLIAITITNVIAILIIIFRNYFC
jgi:hypothetical protein